MIFDEYPGLESLPWVELGEFPTPVHRLEKYGGEVGFLELYIKRDDRSSSIYGGNKVRKLEFVLADAERKGRKLLITLGGTGSNQVLATGIFGGRMGFRVTGVMMDQPNADYVRRNLLLDHHFGVEIKYTPNTASELLTFAYQYLKSYATGGKPYYVPAGASSTVGNLGFVNAAFELRGQVESGLIPEPDYVVCAAGSLGTAAGLELGFRLSGMKTRVVGVRVAMPWYVTRGRFAGMVNGICGFMRRADSAVPRVRCSKEGIILLEDYLGEEYAAFTGPGVETVRRMRELEGMTLDPTYTGKALGGGLDWLRKQGLQDRVVLFWNTYNSVDLSHLVDGANYHVLPKAVHRYFEEPTQEELLTAS
ncbi:MAG: pyridoxal-phosphate dependent enzyme [Candidatus Bathyarchaeota archaeon]|nr:pyridoxal-phosphate dependent enzyme [Candidatus Bathyarchaeota archaeon]